MVPSNAQLGNYQSEFEDSEVALREKSTQDTAITENRNSKETFLTMNQ